MRRGGFSGFHDEHRQPILLTPELVDQIHHEGGTILGSSRGGFELDKIIGFLQEKEICQVMEGTWCTLVHTSLA